MAPKSAGQRFAEDLEERECERLQDYALKSKVRRSDLGNGFREYENADLEYRTEYQRDRDRIIWSRSFKRLQHKTQILPAYSTDHFRRRLTHVLEVTQVATSIARALSINEDATEAMALAHDIGHAPFGHAGERALEEALSDVKEQLDRKEKSEGHTDGEQWDTAVPVFAFNHALQGIETVDRIETESELKHPGLTFTHDVREGILKHRRWRGKDELRISGLSDVVAFSEYKALGADLGPLEAQCVLLADKITYFFEDFEDALRSHVLNASDVSERLKTFGNKLSNSVRKKFRPIHFDKVTDIDSFLAFRRCGLAAFILNAIMRAEEMIRKHSVRSLEDVRSCDQPIVGLQPAVEEAREDVYRECIEDNTFGHELYQATDFKAKRIVKDLLRVYHQNQRLIPTRYREHAEEVYEDLVPDDDKRRVLMVRNYIAGMTDLFAIARHKDLFMSGEQIQIA